MATVVSSYPPNMHYHHQPYFNPKLSSFYRSNSIHNNYYQAKSPKQQQQLQTPTVTVEYIDSNVKSSRPRREPRIHRQVILLPTPDPIYRQVRHRLPTPERQVIQRTVIQKANGAVIVQQKRHRKKARSQSRSETTKQTRSPRT